LTRWVKIIGVFFKVPLGILVTEYIKYNTTGSVLTEYLVFDFLMVSDFPSPFIRAAKFSLSLTFHTCLGFNNGPRDGLCTSRPKRPKGLYKLCGSADQKGLSIERQPSVEEVLEGMYMA
jgi:hypothetical protein